MLQFVIALVVSFLTGMILVHYAHLHEHLSGDHDLSGVQKFHTTPVPRIGGLGLILGLSVSGTVLWLQSQPHLDGFYLLLLTAIPAFLSGFYEDISKHGGVLLRMSCIVLSAALAWWLLGNKVSRIGWQWADAALALPLVSFLFTAMAVSGITNAINFVDGYNGLAGAVCAIMLAGIAYVAFLQGDHLVWAVAISAVGAIAGFLFWNWPRGLIFLGDGGAYLLGFLIAELTIMLVIRNPRVSPWFALLVVSYPMVETVFTILRRVARRSNPGLPDAAHLHQLIYKRMMRWAVGSSLPRHRLFRNSMTSPYLWSMSSLGVVPAVLFWDNTLALQIAALLFIALYVWLYRSIVAFRSPRWLVISKHHKRQK